MASCPSCQAQIEIGSEFFGGLFTCPLCSAVYFIGFDGTPESAQAPVASYLDAATPDQQIPYEGLSAHPESLPMEPFSADLQAPSSEAYAPYEPVAQESPSTFSPLQDVVDFANSESATSLASYNLRISGLEFNENLQAFKDVLIDSKLRISFEDIRSKIKNGSLVLEKLSPAQAAVLAFRLRPLSLVMKWEQSLL